MKLDQALDEFGLEQRRRHRGEEGRRTAAALAALQEFLIDYSGFTETTEIQPADLLQFLLEYYPAEEEPTVEVALALLEVSAGFALWLTERGERQLAPFYAMRERLQRDLPRVLEALDLLKRHAHRDDLTMPMEVSEDGEEQPLGTLSSGAERVARLDQIDYTAAEQDYYRVARVTEGALVLRSEARDALGEGAAEPVTVPLEASERLRPGDIIHAEIAPGPAGWELLEVFGIRPGTDG